MTVTEIAIQNETIAWAAVEAENPGASPMDLIQASDADTIAVRTWRAAYMTLVAIEEA